MRGKASENEQACGDSRIEALQKDALFFTTILGRVDRLEWCSGSLLVSVSCMRYRDYISTLYVLHG